MRGENIDWQNGIAGTALEQCRRIGTEAFQDFLHDGLTEQYGFGIDLETAAIFAYCSHFLIIQIDDLPVPPYQGILFPAHESWIDPRYRLLLSQFAVNFSNP